MPGERHPPRRVVVVTGPESCGKSTLAHDLAADRGGIWVAEVARDYLTGAPSTGYTPQDLLHIAQRQYAAETCAHPADGLTILDTDALVLELWWRERFGAPPPTFLDLLDRWLAQRPRYYLLCQPDLPWERDPLREHSAERERLYDWHERRLQGLADAAAMPAQALYGVVSGRGPARLDCARGLLAAWERG